MVEYILWTLAGAAIGFLVSKFQGKSKLTHTQNTVADLQAENSKYTKRASELQVELDAQNSQYKDLKKSFSNHAENLEDLNKKYVSLKDKAIKIQNENDDLKSELESYRKNYSLLEQELSKINSKLN